jgi:hypothetical protein
VKCQGCSDACTALLKKKIDPKNPHGIVVGQTLFYVPSTSWQGRAREVHVAKIGRKWISCGEGWGEIRADLATLRVIGDGYGDTWKGRCYISKAVHEKKVRLSTMWDDTRRLFANQYSLPAHITEQDIITITAIMENQKRGK